MDNSVIKRDSGMVNDLTTAFQEYAKSLGRMDLYNYYFTFRRNDVKDLTKVEFGKIMDDYQIPSTQRYGRRGNLVVIDHQESGSIRKTILIFARSKNRKYDVVVAEGKMSTNLDWERTGWTAFMSAAISGAAYYATNPTLGIVAGAISLFRIGSNINSGPNNHEFEDVVTDFMIKQLIAAQDLIVERQGKLAFVHDGEHTLLGENPGTDHSSCCIIT